ncbi:hypothetical protein M404DRAFT_150283, partial [Pisolithus tinctorius Marx 270]
MIKDINASSTAPADVLALITSSNSPLLSVSVVDTLKESTLAIYAATMNLASHAKLFFGDTSSNVTILKGDSEDVTELVLSGVFEIDCQGLFIAPNGGFNPKNAFSHESSETKLMCNLLAVQCDAVYGFMQQDFPLIISNIRALEKLMPLKKGETLLLCMCESHGMLCIHLSHALFTKKDNDDDPGSIAHNDEHVPFFQCFRSHVHVSEEATTAWPVPDNIKDMLHCAACTHNISPLPAFDIDGTPIQPVDYLWLLSGAVTWVHFALLNFFIKGDRKLIF